MCSNEENGIKFVWKVENFPDESTFCFSGFEFMWPDESKSKWMIWYLQDMCLSGKENIVTVEKKDDCPPFKCHGTVSVITADDNVYALGELEHDFKENASKVLTLVDLRGTITEDKLLPNNTLTLFIRLWNTEEITANVTHHVYSRYAEQKCSFRWNLATCLDESGYPYLVENTTEVPRDFHSFLEKKQFNLVIALQVKNNSKFLVSKKRSFGIEASSKVSSCLVKCQLDSMKENGESDIFLKTSWNILKEKNKKLKCPLILDLQKLTDLSESGITLNCHVTVVTGSEGVIEKVDYLPNNENSFKYCLEPTNIEYAYVEQPLSACNSMIVEETLTESLYNLYEEGQFCDVILQIGGNNFPCHKIVLCARSSVFKTIFDDEELERNKPIKITDVDKDSFAIFLPALYTGKLIISNWEDALKLYATSYIYITRGLQIQCMDYILTYLAVSNVCDVFELIEKYPNEDLKEQTEYFFYTHAREIIESPEFVSFIRNKPIRASELMQMAFLNE